MRNFYEKYEFWIWLSFGLILFFIGISGVLNAHASTLKVSGGGIENIYHVDVYQSTGANIIIASTTIPSVLNPFVIGNIRLQLKDFSCPYCGQYGYPRMQLKVNGQTIGYKEISGPNPDNFFNFDFSSYNKTVNPLDSYELILTIYNFQNIDFYSSEDGAESCENYYGYCPMNLFGNAYYDISGSAPSDHSIVMYYPIDQSNIQVLNKFQTIYNLKNADVNSSYSAKVYYYLHNSTVISSSTISNLPLFAENTILNFPVNQSSFLIGTQYDAYAELLKDGNTLATSSPIAFVLSTSSIPIPPAGWELATATLPYTSSTLGLSQQSCVSLTTSTEVFWEFSIPWFYSGTGESVICHFQNGFNVVFSTIMGAVNTAMNTLFNQIVKAFPVNVFYNLNNDFYLASQNSSSETDIIIPAMGKNYTLLSQNIADTSTIGKIRELITKIIWLVIGVIMLIEAILLVSHFKQKE